MASVRGSIRIRTAAKRQDDRGATLTQNSDKVRFTNDNIDPKGLRPGWRPNQQIAISRGIDDSGMSQLDFRDERYLPFEGTGAVSKWKLDMPRATNRIDFNSISDVIIHLRYTALDGGEEFRNKVTEQKKGERFTGKRYLSLRQEFPVEWNSATPEKTFMLTRNMFPANLGDIKLLTASRVVFNKGAGPGVPPRATFSPPGKTTGPDGQDQWQFTIVPTDADDIGLLVEYDAALEW